MRPINGPEKEVDLVERRRSSTVSLCRLTVPATIRMDDPGDGGHPRGNGWGDDDGLVVVVGGGGGEGSDTGGVVGPIVLEGEWERVEPGPRSEKHSGIGVEKKADR